MASKILKALNLDDQQTTPNILLLMLSIEGVSSVDFFPESRHADIVFDEELTSPSEIAKTLETSGHLVSKSKEREEGSCCGGCCQ